MLGNYNGFLFRQTSQDQQVVYLKGKYDTPLGSSWSDDQEFPERRGLKLLARKNAISYLTKDTVVPHINRNGVKIHYAETGPEDAPSVILSHGHASASPTWSSQVRALSRHYRIITWDLRGHGLSDCPNDPGLYTVDHTVDDIAAILDACGIDKAVIGGHSLGGVMSFQFQLKYPERVSAMLIISSGPGFRNDAVRNEWNLGCERTAASLQRKGLSALEKNNDVEPGWHTDVQGLIHAARGMMTQKDAGMIDNLADIDVPVLILVGAHDKSFLGAAEYMAKKIPDARKVVIDNAGHAANMDQPQTVNQEILTFLKRLS